MKKFQIWYSVPTYVMISAEDEYEAREKFDNKRLDEGYLGCEIGIDDIEEVTEDDE